MALDERKLNEARRPGFGLGLLKGMAVTLKHLFKHNTVIQYPDEKQDLPSRTRGVIALKEENCTVCMLCARECPDWCIYIDSHKETLPPKRQGGRPRKRNVLDRFAIDYALCMYCGICVEVCPYDALFWSREFEYSEYDIRQLTHEKERLSDWMATVLPPPDLEEGAELPGQATEATPTVEATGARPASLTSSAVEARPEQAAAAPTAGTAAPTEARPAASAPDAGAERGPVPETSRRPPGLDAEVEAAQGLAGATTQPEPEVRVERDGSSARVAPAPAASQVGPEATTSSQRQDVVVPSPKASATSPEGRAPSESPEAAYERVLKEQLGKGSSPQVAEARAKVARLKAERGIARPATPAPAIAPVRSAPQATPTEPEPSGAPEAKEPEPDPGPVAPTTEEGPH
jgi:formate hydrogenlyase subunit 6/NADH:ubiquinone oxidoreductase subunit I